MQDKPKICVEKIDLDGKKTTRVFIDFKKHGQDDARLVFFFDESKKVSIKTLHNDQYDGWIGGGYALNQNLDLDLFKELLTKLTEIVR